MSDIVERLREYASDDHERGCAGRYYDCSCGYDGKRDPLMIEAAAEIERLRAALRNMDQHMEENITLTEALRQEQEWVIRLSKALRGVLRVADRNTKEFNEARAALGGET